MSVVCVKFRCNILISGKIIKEMPGSVASGTLCILLIPSSPHCPLAVCSKRMWVVPTADRCWKEKEELASFLVLAKNIAVFLDVNPCGSL